MKTLFTAMFLFILSLTQAQYFQHRFNLNYNVPLLRNERFNSGIKTTVNFIGGNPANFYYAAIGTSYNNPALAAPDNVADRMRFTLVGTQGLTLFNNRGYQFSNANNTWLNSAGNGIAEIDDGGAGNGGYLAVGAVANNAATQATVAGSSDILVTRLSAVGAVVVAAHIDINNSKDIAWCIRRSRVTTTAGKPTWIFCGQAISPNNTSDCVVARITTNGTIVWCKRYNFPAPNGTPAFCAAKQLCEDANGNIYVVGTWQVPGAANIDGLAFKLGQGGGVAWSRTYNVAADDELQAVRLTNGGNSIVAGGFTNIGGMYNMLLVQINNANGNLNFSNVLRAQDAGGNVYPSQCHDVVQTPAGEFFLAGFLVKNGINVQMMYRAAANNMGLDWHSYNKMTYSTGFGVDYVNGAYPGIAYFSSLKNLENPGFSDSYMMKADMLGRTCSFCSAHAPSTLPVNLVISKRSCLHADAGTRETLNTLTSNYAQRQMCNLPAPCPGVDRARPADKVGPIISAVTGGGLKISPNPVVNVLHVQVISLPAGEYQITLTDMAGKTVLKRNSTYNNGSSFIDLDMSSFAPGVYLLAVRQGEILLTQKILKQ